MAKYLFWGVQGLKRNVEASMEFFKLAAKNNDPDALYNYGLNLMHVNSRAIITIFEYSLCSALKIHT